jgi:radical SAM superfamily enzyme YgiQ (UPF0313 family)
MSQDANAGVEVPVVHTRKTKGLRVALLLNIPSISTRLGRHAPISLLYLGAQLTRQGHTPSMLDRRTFAKDQDFLRALKNVDPQLVGISLYADCYGITYQLINRIRRYAPDVRIVLGGPEVSANRDGVAQVFDGKVDFLLCGEAEFTLGSLADALCDGDEAALEAIEGLSFKTDGVWRHNAAPKPIKDVDGIPFPQRDLISPENWRAHYYRIGLKRPSDVILTSRGCPFSCRFCYRLTTGYRARSPESVLAELDAIRARGIGGFSIIDDNFLSSRKRCIAILEGILAKNWRPAIKCRGRVDSIDPALLGLMKRAGVRAVTFGMESGSQEVLDAMGKRASVEQNLRAIRMTREAGLQCYVDLFLGYPGETRETIRQTADFLTQARPTGINMGVLFPLHGTEIYEEARRRGTLRGDWGLLEDYPWVKLPWFDDISELWEERRKVARRFWFNPRIITGTAWSTLSTFGIRDYIDALKELRTQFLKWW